MKRKRALRPLLAEAQLAMLLDQRTGAKKESAWRQRMDRPWPQPPSRSAPGGLSSRGLTGGGACVAVEWKAGLQRRIHQVCREAGLTNAEEGERRCLPEECRSGARL